jgi:uncharacterized protein (UPF0303 family)
MQTGGMDLKSDLELIAIQERELVLPRFDEDVAWELGSRIRDLAVSRGLQIVIEIRRTGQLLFYCALKGTSPDNADWVRRKSNSVARFYKSSYALGLGLKEIDSTLEERYQLSPADYAAHGGSFPLQVAATGYVGSVTVSGLPQRADHQLVVEALCLHLGRDFSLFRLPEPAAA